MEQTKPGQPIQLILTTEIEQEGQIKKHLIETTGHFVQMRETSYIRYQEENEDGKHGVTLKISGDGTLTIIRSSPVTSKLKFNEATTFENIYQTVHGAMQLISETEELKYFYQPEPLQGELYLNYQLRVGEEKLGDYKLELQFKG